ncbi:MAG: hypothetical protein KF774_05785 [Planctomyces sp.]|nr:hypothetical protein [Planctomyces sp.]
MSPALASALWPFVLLLSGCGVAGVALLRFSGMKLRPGKWRRLAGDESGAVQSLAFVMTFPLFLLLALFVAQISQLMIAVCVVHYAAFAAARSASVWIPASTGNARENELPDGRPVAAVWRLSLAGVEQQPNRKSQEILSAAALACAAIAPSRQVGPAPSPLAASAAVALAQVVPALDAAAGPNARLPQRLANKVGYSYANTTVDIRIIDSGIRSSVGGLATYNPTGHPIVRHNPSEAGWQDGVEATVRHRFVLLPGPARWLAAGIANRDGRIIREDGVYKTSLSATATMTLEGLQSLRPTVHAP